MFITFTYRLSSTTDNGKPVFSTTSSFVKPSSDSSESLILLLFCIKNLNFLYVSGQTFVSYVFYNIFVLLIDIFHHHNSCNINSSILILRRVKRKKTKKFSAYLSFIHVPYTCYANAIPVAMHLFSNLQSESAKVQKVNFNCRGYKIKCNAMSMYLVILLNSLSHSGTPLCCFLQVHIINKTKKKVLHFNLLPYSSFFVQYYSFPITHMQIHIHTLQINKVHKQVLQ